MPTNKHRATAPDGTVLTRNSRARTYTHCIAGLKTEEALRRRAEGLIGQYTRWLDSYQRKLNGEDPLGPYESTATLGENARRTAKLLQEAQQELDAIDGDRWCALSWVSRPDLIPARISEFERRGAWAQVIAVPAEII